MVDGSQELRVLKEKLHAAQVNKVWARQLLEKQEREEMALQEEAKLAAHLEENDGIVKIPGTARDTRYDSDI